jgi:hypothetical protein
MVKKRALHLKQYFHFWNTFFHFFWGQNFPIFTASIFAHTQMFPFGENPFPLWAKFYHLKIEGNWGVFRTGAKFVQATFDLKNLSKNLKKLLKVTYDSNNIPAKY